VLVEVSVLDSLGKVNLLLVCNVHHSRGNWGRSECSGYGISVTSLMFHCKLTGQRWVN
jgi:hypothetical protein